MTPDATYRPRRSMLYTPGTRADRIEKALTMRDGPDMVVADLEDAVAPDEKATARADVAEVIERVTGTRAERCIRVNAPGTPWHEDDLAAAVAAKPDALVVPKVDSIKELSDLELDLEAHEEEQGLQQGAIVLHVQLETARGVARAVELAETIADQYAPLTRVESFLFGALDYAADVGCLLTPTHEAVAYPRQRIVMAAAIAGIQAIDLLFPDYEDAQGLRENAAQGRTLGYVGKQIIHPAQIEPVHEAFTPSKDEIGEARELLEAVEDAGIGRGGVIGFKGRMVDRPVIEQARRITALANSLGL